MSNYALLVEITSLPAAGVFTEHPDRRFALSAMGDLLRRDHPLSLDPAARMFGADYQWRAWGALRHSVETGENAAAHALGTDVWEYRRLHSEHGEIFDATMRTLSAGDNPGVLAAHDFGRYRLIADIGGGTGAVLAAVLAAHTDTRGILFDQPYVIANADVVLRAAGVADRATAVPGDFFEGVPEGADAYLLVRILHDWADAQALRILRNVRAAMTPDAVLVIVDSVLGPPNEDPLAKFLDLMMLVSAGGRERTERSGRHCSPTVASSSSPRGERRRPGTSSRHGRCDRSFGLQATEGCHIEQFPHAVFPSSYDELIAVTAGEPADVA